MKKKIAVEGIKNIKLDHIFECGQCFRWNKESDESYTVVAFDRIVNMKMEGAMLVLRNTTPSEFSQIWKEFLDLERDYDEIINIISKDDDAMKLATKEGYGIRILNQDPWEMLISFIISANNNIPRIKGIIESLSKNFGKYLGSYNDVDYYSFPRPDDIAKLKIEDLTPCRMGYRARYVLETAKKVSEEGEEKLIALKDEDIEVVVKKLLEYTGVGEKVAHCIALFGFGKLSAFPIDVWMRRVMAELYGINVDDVKAMMKTAEENFGEYAGIAQQYLFHYMRNKFSKNEVEEDEDPLAKIRGRKTQAPKKESRGTERKNYYEDEESRPKSKAPGIVIPKSMKKM